MLTTHREPGLVPNASLTPTFGPLLTSVMALFGPQTWAATRMNATFSNSSTDSNKGTPQSCSSLDAVPMQRLLVSGLGFGEEKTLDLPLCSSTSPDTYFNDLNTWLQSFLTDPETVLTIALFYANEASLEQAAATADRKSVV